MSHEQLHRSLRIGKFIRDQPACCFAVLGKLFDRRGSRAMLQAQAIKRLPEEDRVLPGTDACINALPSLR
jgi:hypothetical protein